MITLHHTWRESHGTRWIVFAMLCLWTATIMARPPKSSIEQAGRARATDRAEESSARGRSRQSVSGRRLLPSVVPAQYEQLETDDRSLVPEPVPAPGATVEAAPDLNPLQHLLDANLTPIDLFSAFRLAGIQNSSIRVAQQRVIESVALRQLAAAQFLPTLNFGMNIDSHRGVLQQSSGNILSVRRDALFVGAGANALAAGTVNIPGVMWSLNVSETIYNYLVSQRQVDRSAFESRTVEQDVLLAVAVGYTDLVRAQGNRSVLAQTREDARELARITAAYASAGAGSQADADRAATELARREAEVIQADGDILTGSTRLCQLLHLDPSNRLQPVDTFVLPRSIVPEPIPLQELIAIAVLHRPELESRRAAIAQAMLNLDAARLLPFSPNLLVGFSAGSFGGGSDIASQPVGSQFFARGQARFGDFAARQDFDVVAYWTLRNLGVANQAQIDAARSRLQSADLERLATLDKVRSEVAAAHARTHARFARIQTGELAIQSSTDAFREDLTRVIGHEGRPLEAVDSLRLLKRSRLAYIDAILDYNAAQFQLYVALGKPPVDVLVRPSDSEIGFDALAANPPVARGPTPASTARSNLSHNKPHAAVGARRATTTQTPVGAQHPILPVSATQVPADEPDSEPDPPRGPSTSDIRDELAGLARESVIPSTGEEFLIDLSNALRLAEAANPEIALGRQAICEALALQLEARGMLLPSLNAGTMYHLHQGRLQTSFGQIRSVNLQSIYFGGGAGTVAANTVAVPAVRIFAQLGEAFNAPLAAGQVVSSRSFASRAINNSVLLEVVSRYLELVASESRLEAIRRSEDDLRQVVLATGAFAEAGQGRVGDFDRARTAALLLHAQEQQAQEEVVVAAGELSRVLHLDPALRLKSRPGPIEIVQLVDPAYSMAQLIEIAHVARPEISSRMADIAAADYRLRQECVRPWLPTLSVGFSGGAFGGGSNQVQSFFQHLGGRTDFDVSAYWTLQNMGMGNAALQKQRRAERDRAVAARGLMYNQIGREVSDSYLRATARRDQFELARHRLETAATGAREEIKRTRGGEGLPLETINSVDLLIEAREAMIRTLIEYNRAQIELFVAIGQTPHVTLADPRGVSGDLFPEPAAESP